MQNGRSVLPTAIDETTTGLKWELVGIKDGTLQTIKYWTDFTDEVETVTAYKSMTSDSGIVIDTGTWDFTLTTSNTDGKNVLSATISATINAGENKLNFVMQEATENAASGSIEFTLNFPEEVVGNVVATLYKYDNDNNVVDDYKLSIVVYWVFSMIYWDKNHLGQLEMDVLFETEQPDGSRNGHAGNYCVVNAKGEGLKNALKTVRITAVDGEKLMGEVV